jgi:hypothetical protein
LEGKRHVCAGLRRLARQRLAEITQTFLDATSSRPPGTGGPIAAKRKNQNLQNPKFQKFAKSKNEKLLIANLVSVRSISKIVSREIVFCSQNQRQNFRFFVFLCPFAMREVYI